MVHGRDAVAPANKGGAKVNREVREHQELTPVPAAVMVETGGCPGGLAATRPRGKAALQVWHGHAISSLAHALATRKRAPDRGKQGKFTGTSNWKITNAMGLTPKRAIHGGEKVRRPRKRQIGDRWYTAELDKKRAPS
jgi:hypothetical protein